MQLCNGSQVVELPGHAVGVDNALEDGDVFVVAEVGGWSALGLFGYDNLRLVKTNINSRCVCKRINSKDTIIFTKQSTLSPHPHTLNT